jgi:hypothetical protein
LLLILQASYTFNRKVWVASKGERIGLAGFSDVHHPVGSSTPLGSSGSRNLKIFFHIEEGCDFDLKVGRCGFMGLSNSFVVFEVQ